MSLNRLLLLCSSSGDTDNPNNHNNPNNPNNPYKPSWSVYCSLFLLRSNLFTPAPPRIHIWPCGFTHRQLRQLSAAAPASHSFPAVIGLAAYILYSSDYTLNNIPSVQQSSLLPQHVTVIACEMSFCMTLYIADSSPRTPSSRPSPLTPASLGTLQVWCSFSPSQLKLPTAVLYQLGPANTLGHNQLIVHNNLIVIESEVSSVHWHTLVWQLESACCRAAVLGCLLRFTRKILGLSRLLPLGIDRVIFCSLWQFCRYTIIKSVWKIK